MQDATLKKNKVDIYCHARKNRENGVIEKMVYLKGEKGQLNVHVVDTSALAIRTLMSRVEFQLLQLSNQSSRFWPWVEDILSQLNYIVIAVGDDRSNMQAVADLFEIACRVCFDNMKNFKVFVRSYSRENEKQLDSLVKFYNDKCGAKNKDEKISDVLVVFGKSSDLFTYENIIDDETIAKAMVFYEGYAGMERQKVERIT